MVCELPAPSPRECRPHVLLFTEAATEGPRGQWRFVLAQVGSSDSFSATDEEPIGCAERLELLAVVRGLEAVDGPSRVTLVTNSRYVNRGLKHGLADWRASQWHWERFGQLVPVRNHDLWRRLDRALQFHELDCRLWHFDGAAGGSADAANLVETAEDGDLPSYRVKNRRRRGHDDGAWRRGRRAGELAAG
ncbi:MAG TPA: RNase H family protein [Lacipirellulaceae bacterium]|nr:RNase H family protein [Lacipirellulaceae bacterium]